MKEEALDFLNNSEFPEKLSKMDKELNLFKVIYFLASLVLFLLLIKGKELHTFEVIFPAIIFMLTIFDANMNAWSALRCRNWIYYDFIHNKHEIRDFREAISKVKKLYILTNIILISQIVIITVIVTSENPAVVIEKCLFIWSAIFLAIGHLSNQHRRSLYIHFKSTVTKPSYIN